MDWIILALIATLLWSFGAVLCKIVRLNFIKNSISYLIISTPITLCGLIFLFFGEFIIPSVKIMSFIILSAISGIIGYWFYLEALHKEEISKTIIFLNMSPIFMLVFASIFLNEILELSDYLAFPLIITGGFLMSLDNNRFRLSKGLFLLVISMIFFTIQNLFLKLSAESNFVTITVIRQMFFLVLFPLIFIVSKKARESTKQDLKDINKKKISLIYLVEILGITGIAFSYMAMQRGPVSLVVLVEGIQPLFVFILALFLTIQFPKILKEEINKKTIIIKIISIILMLVGLYLIAQ